MTEVIVTPEMLEAGYKSRASSTSLADVYRAMHALAPGSQAAMGELKVVEEYNDFLMVNQWVVKSDSHWFSTQAEALAFITSCTPSPIRTASAEEDTRDAKRYRYTRKVLCDQDDNALQEAFTIAGYSELIPSEEQFDKVIDAALSSGEKGGTT